MAFLTKEQLLGARLKCQEVPVPELGGSVFVREWSGAVHEKVKSLFAEVKSEGDLKSAAGMREKIIATSLCDENGNLLFAENHEPLMAISEKALTRIFEAVVEFNGGGKSEAEEKNLPKTP